MKRIHILSLGVALCAFTSMYAEDFEDQELISQEEITFSAEEEAIPAQPSAEMTALDLEALPLFETEDALLSEEIVQIPVVDEEITIVPMKQEALSEEPTALILPMYDAKPEPVAASQIPAEEVKEPAAAKESSWVSFQIDFRQVFAGAPVIYSLLLLLSVGAFFIWLYCIMRLNQVSMPSDNVLKLLSDKLNSNQYEEARFLCQQHDNFLFKMIAAGIGSRKHGPSMMMEAVRAEGKRATVVFWQRLGLLNDIAIIAPMLGLLGTVLGMFYAFYDLNRSMESLATLFDGLGISVGTTVAGLIVAILALVLHALAKYRLIKLVTHIENEAQALTNRIDCKSSAVQEG
jgi:biopolymer transport protein ExbB